MATRIETICKAFIKADAEAKSVVLDAALAEIHGRVRVALEYDLADNDVEAAAVASARFPEKTDGAKRSQFLLVIKTAPNYDALAKVARSAHVEAQAAGDKSSRVAGKYLTAAKLQRTNGKTPGVKEILAEKTQRVETPALQRVEKRYKDLLAFAKDEGITVTGTLTFTASAAPLDKEALKAMLKASGMDTKQIAALLKS